ncbi:hypothetical protein NMY22_g19247 [Coprinellus aureogranulatus]|nr:hypothetical protein NMY22_g19247 [Coprinellus aureogranulatus]
MGIGKEVEKDHFSKQYGARGPYPRDSVTRNEAKIARKNVSDARRQGGGTAALHQRRNRHGVPAYIPQSSSPTGNSSHAVPYPGQVLSTGLTSAFTLSDHHRHRQLSLPSSGDYNGSGISPGQSNAQGVPILRQHGHSPRDHAWGVPDPDSHEQAQYALFRPSGHGLGNPQAGNRDHSGILGLPPFRLDHPQPPSEFPAANQIPAATTFQERSVSHGIHTALGPLNAQMPTPPDTQQLPPQPHSQLTNTHPQQQYPVYPTPDTSRIAEPSIRAEEHRYPVLPTPVISQSSANSTLREHYTGIPGAHDDAYVNAARVNSTDGAAQMNQPYGQDNMHQTPTYPENMFTVTQEDSAFTANMHAEAGQESLMEPADETNGLTACPFQLDRWNYARKSSWSPPTRPMGIAKVLRAVTFGDASVSRQLPEPETRTMGATSGDPGVPTDPRVQSRPHSAHSDLSYLTPPPRKPPTLPRHQEDPPEDDTRPPVEAIGVISQRSPAGSEFLDEPQPRNTGRQSETDFPMEPVGRTAGSITPSGSSSSPQGPMLQPQAPPEPGLGVTTQSSGAYEAPHLPPPNDVPHSGSGEGDFPSTVFNGSSHPWRSRYAQQESLANAAASHGGRQSPARISLSAPQQHGILPTSALADALKTPPSRVRYAMGYQRGSTATGTTPLETPLPPNPSRSELTFDHISQSFCSSTPLGPPPASDLPFNRLESRGTVPPILGQTPLGAPPASDGFLTRAAESSPLSPLRSPRTGDQILRRREESTFPEHVSWQKGAQGAHLTRDSTLVGQHAPQDKLSAMQTANHLQSPSQRSRRGNPAGTLSGGDRCVTSTTTTRPPLLASLASNQHQNAPNNASSKSYNQTPGSLNDSMPYVQQHPNLPLRHGVSSSRSRPLPQPPLGHGLSSRSNASHGRSQATAQQSFVTESNSRQPPPSEHLPPGIERGRSRSFAEDNFQAYTSYGQTRRPDTMDVDVNMNGTNESSTSGSNGRSTSLRTSHHAFDATKEKLSTAYQQTFGQQAQHLHKSRALAQETES